MNGLILGFVFFISLLLGSFYNVVALRTLNGKGVAFPPSHCVNCNTRLSVLDLVPVLSYMCLRGRCRYCKEKISPIYPFGEVLTAISYTLILNKFGFTLEAVINVSFITIMILATVTDLKEMIVPDRFTIVGLLIIGILRVIHGEKLLFFVSSSILSFLVLLSIFILSKGKMGGADVKIYALIGLAIGIGDSIGSLFYASFAALIYYAPLMIKGRAGKDLEIPFIPFITIGVLSTYVLTLFDFSMYM